MRSRLSTQVLDLALSRQTVAGNPVCVYPEAKSPAYHAAIGHPDMAEKILASLKAKGLDKKGAPVFIQSFEPPFVKKIQPMTEVAVVMLVGDKAALDAAMKVEGAPFWDGLGATHQMLFDARRQSDQPDPRRTCARHRRPHLDLPRRCPVQGRGHRNLDEEGAGARPRRLLHRLPVHRLSRGE